MARTSRLRALGLWVNGVRAGEWLDPARGAMEFRYARSWLDHEDGRPLSLSLPLDSDPLRGRAVEAYFENLLPDSVAIRRRIQERYRTDSGGAFSLLAAIGRDCVGAVQLLPPDEEPSRIFTIEAEPLTEAGVEKALLRAISTPEPGLPPLDEDFRISLGGAQEKTAFLWHRGRWCRPRGATPSTHIFKLPLGLVGGIRADMSLSVENEWLCAQILRAYGLPVASCEIRRFGSQTVLVVERFDRVLHSSGKYWLRLVQEDFCQATGTPPSMKYERDGGPGVEAMAALLRGSLDRDMDLVTLLKAQLIFWMLAATDGHAKNFSMRILAGGTYRLTPLYDVISIWPIIGKSADRIRFEKARLAMSVRGKEKHYLLKEIQRRHFVELAARCGMSGEMDRVIDGVVGATAGVVERVRKGLPRGFPLHVADTVLAGLESGVKRLAGRIS